MRPAHATGIPRRRFRYARQPAPHADAGTHGARRSRRLKLLAGHRISLGARTMDLKAQIVGEFVKSIRVPGSLSAAARAAAAAPDDGGADGRTRAHAGSHRRRSRSRGRRDRFPRVCTMRPIAVDRRAPWSRTSTAAAGCKAISRRTTACAPGWPCAPARSSSRSTIGWRPSTNSPPPSRIASPRTAGFARTRPSSARIRRGSPSPATRRAGTCRPWCLSSRRAAGVPVPTCQVLIYPAVGFRARHGVASRARRRPHHSARPHRLVRRAVPAGRAPTAAIRAPHRCERRDLAGQPPALIVTAGFDPLRDEGHAYAERLRAAGVDVVDHEYTGQIHAFVSLTKAIPQGHGLHVEIADFLKERLA